MILERYNFYVRKLDGTDEPPPYEKKVILWFEKRDRKGSFYWVEGYREKTDKKGDHYSIVGFEFSEKKPVYWAEIPDIN